MCDIRKIFASNIKRIRKSLGLTQEQFAEAIEMQPKSVINFESARNLPTGSNLQKICDKLNISPVRLFIEERCAADKEKIKEITSMLEVMDASMLDIVSVLVEALKNK